MSSAPATPLSLVTGGAGFIGSHLCRALLARGGRVRVVDDLSTGSLDNLALAGAGETRRLEFIRGDLLDDDLAQWLDGVETVYHHAALVSVQGSIDDPVQCCRVNVEGTVRLLEHARAAGVGKVVYASSSAVYGEAGLPNEESMAPCPASPYAVSKTVNELYGSVYSSVLGLPTIGLRYFNVFGPRQDPSSEYAAVIPRFISRMLAGREPIVYGDGGQSRDFIYVDNVVGANLAAAASDASGLSLNIASGVRITLNDLVDRLNAVLETDFEARYADPRPGEVRHSVAAVERAKEHIDYRVQVPFDEGLRRTVDWFRAAPGRSGR